VGPRAGLDRCGKISPTPELDPRAVQPVACHYTDYATRPTDINSRRGKISAFGALCNKMQRACVKQRYDFFYCSIFSRTFMLCDVLHVCQCMLGGEQITSFSRSPDRLFFPCSSKRAMFYPTDLTVLRNNGTHSQKHQ